MKVAPHFKIQTRTSDDLTLNLSTVWGDDAQDLREKERGEREEFFSLFNIVSNSLQ